MDVTAQKIDDQQAQTPVAQLEGITPSEIKKLQKAKIETLGALCTALGAQKPELSNFDKLVTTTGISGDRLVELLPAHIIDFLRGELWRRLNESSIHEYIQMEAIPAGTLDQGSFWRRAWLVARETRPWFRRHMLDWILLFCSLSLVLLALRATGCLDRYLPSIGLNPSVVITKRDLRAGDFLRVDRDLSQARLPLKENYFDSMTTLEGLVLRRDVSAEKPLRSEDVLRFQVVASREIDSGEKLTKDSVKLDWSKYDPKALMQIKEALERTSKYAIRKDEVVVSDMFIP